MSIDFNSVSDWINKQVAAGKLLHYDVDGAKLDMIDFSDRKMVLANVLGEKVPFYLSTGQAGKKNVPAGKWYPFFGVGQDGWINKTTQAEIASYYNNPYFKKIGEALDKNIGDLRPYSIGQDAELGHFHDIHKIVGDASGLYGVSHSDKDAYNKIITNVSAVSQRMYDAAKAQKAGIPPNGASTIQSRHTITPDIHNALGLYADDSGTKRTNKFFGMALDTLGDEVDKTIPQGHIGGLTGTGGTYNQPRFNLLKAIAESKGYDVGIPVPGNGTYAAKLTKKVTTTAPPVTPITTPVNPVAAPIVPTVSTPPPGGGNNGGSTPPPGGGNKPPQPSGRQPNSKMSHLFDNNRFVSIDIETSGRDAAKDKIWNIGLKWSNGKKRNLFLVDDANYTMGHSTDASVLAQREQVVDRMKAQLESGNFGKRQAAKGSFNDLYKAIREGTAITSEGAAKYISNIVGHLGASNQAKFTLIQNARFEDQFLTKLMQDYGVFDKAKHGMEFRTNYTEGYAGFLYSPPDITTLKANAAQSFEKYLAGTGSFDEVAKHHEAIVNSYFSHINNAPKGISVDLMDLTKAFYAKAAEKGLLRKQDIHVGTNIEFLSQLFYDQAEAHTGLEDAVLQEKLAIENIAAMYDRLHGNALTDDDRNMFVKMSDMQQRAHRLQLISGLKTGLEESQTAAGYKLTGTRKFYPLTPIIDSQNRLHPLSVYRQIDAHYTKDVAATIEDVVNSSARRLEVHPDDVKSILNEIGKHDDVDGKIAALYEMGDNYWGKPKIPSKPMPTKEEVKESVGWLKSLNGAQKTVVGLGVAGALYAGLSDDNASKHKVREIKKRKEYQERRYDLDSNMRIYSKLDNYHGSGFATWNDRTKHHEY